ncbi:hypothetical protein DRN75_03835 [Nanoarchaeota archaeon]|nr:MAG: hypothetical protein DRN75_03835 [Nanoarchaeota archaeon]
MREKCEGLEFSCGRKKESYFLELSIPLSRENLRKMIYWYSSLLMSKKGNKINLNKFAKRIAKREGLKKQVNIAQIKEILRIILEELAMEDILKVLATLEDMRL